MSITYLGDIRYIVSNARSAKDKLDTAIGIYLAIEMAKELGIEGADTAGYVKIFHNFEEYTIMKVAEEYNIEINDEMTMTEKHNKIEQVMLSAEKRIEFDHIFNKILAEKCGIEGFDKMSKAELDKGINIYFHRKVGRKLGVKGVYNMDIDKLKDQIRKHFPQSEVQKILNNP